MNLNLKVLDLAVRVLTIGLISLLLVQQNQLITKVNQINLHDVRIERDTVLIEVPTPPKSNVRPKSQGRTSKVIKTGMYGSFVVYTPIDTTISDELRLAIHNYCGPSVKVNSMRRHGTKSGHCKGRAIDLEFCPNLIDYLVSDEGQQWLESHNLIFYIEGKPGSKKVRYYNWGKYKEYVFFNPKATGDHVHLEVS